MLYSIFLLIICNIILCKVYCTVEQFRDNRRKKKNIKKKACLQYSDDNVLCIKRHPLWKKLILELLNISDWWLKLNMLVFSYIPSYTVRNFWYSVICGMKLGKNVVIHYGLEARAPWKITIGDGTVIGDKVILDGRNGITIGRNVNFSTGVWIWTMQHDPNDSEFGTCGGPVVIGDRAWLSCRTVILPNVTIGEGAVVAASAVVTKDCKAYGMYGGVPAKYISERNRNLTYEFEGVGCWFV